MLKNVETVTMHSEVNVLLATDLAKIVQEAHSNVLNVLTTSSIQTEDVSQLVPMDNSLMLFQEPADNALQHVLLAVQNSSVPLVQTIRSSPLEDNAYHVFTHVPTAQLISVSVTAATVDFIFPAETV